MLNEIECVSCMRAGVDPSLQGTIGKLHDKTFEWPITFTDAKSTAAGFGKVGKLAKHSLCHANQRCGKSSFAMRCRCHHTMASPGSAVKNVITKNVAQPSESESMPAGAPSRLRGSTAIADSAAY